jgi:hypothetical protein
MTGARLLLVRTGDKQGPSEIVVGMQMSFSYCLVAAQHAHEVFDGHYLKGMAG